jgi:hypothetical protein
VRDFLCVDSDPIKEAAPTCHEMEALNSLITGCQAPSVLRSCISSWVLSRWDILQSETVMHKLCSADPLFSVTGSQGFQWIDYLTSSSSTLMIETEQVSQTFVFSSTSTQLITREDSAVLPSSHTQENSYSQKLLLVAVKIRKGVKHVLRFLAEPPRSRPVLPIRHYRHSA